MWHPWVESLSGNPKSTNPSEGQESAMDLGISRLKSRARQAAKDTAATQQEAAPMQTIEKSARGQK